MPEGQRWLSQRPRVCPGTRPLSTTPTPIPPSVEGSWAGGGKIPAVCLPCYHLQLRPLPSLSTDSWVHLCRTPQLRGRFQVLTATYGTQHDVPHPLLPTPTDLCPGRSLCPSPLFCGSQLGMTVSRRGHLAMSRAIWVVTTGGGERLVLSG